MEGSISNEATQNTLPRLSQTTSLLFREAKLPRPEYPTLKKVLKWG
jgi:hypothetical protein